MAVMFTIVCVLSACQTAKAPSPALTGDGRDSAAIYQAMAYRETFTDSLAQAEAHAYRAFMLSNDSTLECGALSLLCYIYYREGKQEELQLLMQTVSPETYMNMMDVQLKVEQVKAGRERWGYTLTIAVLLLLLGFIGLWYFYRMKSLDRLYHQRIQHVMSQRDGSLVTSGDVIKETSPCEIGETKAGIDVLFAIINDQNISQMGKQEEQAVLKTLPIVDSALAATLAKASSPLTPKETFFCIMEYYGKNDRQKARSFCCSEQAIRSTKSRLNKKIDISVLRSE